MRFLFRLIKWTIVISLAIFLIHIWLLTKTYIMTDDAIAKISNKYSGKDVQSSFKKIYTELEKTYPGHILPESDHQWIFVNAGGWMGAMCLMHASLTEYILFFGTAVDTSGHSGRYWANITDTLISGEMKQWREGQLKANIFKPGDTVSHAWGEVTGIQFKADTWMVEYGRGFIPSALGFALADTIFSTQDMVTLFYVLRIYVKALYMESVSFALEMKELVL